MKRRIVITFVLGMTIFNVVAQECQIMDSKQGSITFVVDENLPKPKFDLRTSSNATGMTDILLSAFGIECVGVQLRKRKDISIHRECTLPFMLFGICRPSSVGTFT